MSVMIQYNIANSYILGGLYASGKGIEKAVERISTGFRINRASDGPADLVESESLRSQLAGIERAIRNTTEAGNMIGTADGALAEMNKQLKIIRQSLVSSVTNPAEEAANQASIDNAIMALDRIAAGTRFGSINLLNGAQNIGYNASVSQSGPQGNRLVDQQATQFFQIFKRDGAKVAVSFNGKTAGGFETGKLGDALMSSQASKAYLDIDTALGSLSFDADGNLSEAVSFVIGGRKGARRIDLAAGSHVSDLVASLQAAADTTGVDASLTFNSNQKINAANAAAATIVGVGVVDGAGGAEQILYDNARSSGGGTALVASKLNSAFGGIVFGKNTDGDGNLFIKVTGSNSYEVYKDASLSKEALVGRGVSGAGVTAVNNSGLTGGDIALTGDARLGDVFRVSLGNVSLDTADNVAVAGDAAGLFSFAAGGGSTASGVRLGQNTDASGKIYIKVSVDGGGNVMVGAYTNDSYDDQYLVAQLNQPVSQTSLGATASLVLDAVKNADGSAGSGLGLTLKTTSDISTLTGEKTLTLQFKNVGGRVYAADYGSSSYIDVTQDSGKVFADYANAGDPGSAYAVGGSLRKTGQDAVVAVNGKVMRTDGLTLGLATTELVGNLVFNAGRAGTTTLAQVGYGEGSLFAKNAALAMAKSGLDADGNLIDPNGPYGGANAHFTGLINNAGHYTAEILDSFRGGMRLQLGYGSSDRDSTVLGIQNMLSESIGRISAAYQESGSAVRYTKQFALRDLLSGGSASGTENRELALNILDQADADVSLLRANLGAFQANALDVNANSLESAMTNISQAESAIRDANIAVETINLTRNLVLSNANIALLAQSNANSDNILKLLGWD